MTQYYGRPEKQGLYEPSMEKDNCGVGFVAHMKGQKSHDIIAQGLLVLENLTHRGAVGSDPNTGDGAGILIQLPHAFLEKEATALNITLPDPGAYGVGMIFLPQEPNARYFCEGVCERIILHEGLEVLGWRHVPVDASACGLTASGTRPIVHQLFIAKGTLSETQFDTKLYIIRKQIEKAIREAKKPYAEAFYVCSLSSKTMIYKGQLLAKQIPDFFPDLKDPIMVSAIALVHQRYSTNTFPSWDLAQPFRYLAHNGEINTLRGNVNWMNAREGTFSSEALGSDIQKIFPIIEPSGSDSASLDNALELLIASGKSLAHAISILIPEAWQGHTHMDPDKKAFYTYHATMMEPWDGPAAVAFTDGVQIGATLDRNGLRPARYLITDDDLVVMASETGVLPFESKSIVKKGRLQPGKMFLIDTIKGAIISDADIKSELARTADYSGFVQKNKMTLDDLPIPHSPSYLSQDRLLQLQNVFGYSEEMLKKVISPMIQKGSEQIASMGNDAPLPVLSEQPQNFYDYFKQLFAQVTNPPIDPIREKLVMSNIQFLGDKGNLLNPLSEDHTSSFMMLDQPILDHDAFEKLVHISHKDFRSIKIPTLFASSQTGIGLELALDRLNAYVEENIHTGYNLIILSDRNVDQYNAPIPGLLAVASVHHYLIRKKLRTKVNLILENGDARTVMEMALLVGYGADAVFPYMALDSIHELVITGTYQHEKQMPYSKALKNYLKALSSGLLKTYSKMGIGTLQSYHGAQIFEAVGIHKSVIDRYFPGTSSRIGGINLDIIAKEVVARHKKAFALLRNPYKGLHEGAYHQWRKEGERHLFNPETIHKLQHACRTNDAALYQSYADAINQQAGKLSTIRGLLKFKSQGPIPIEEVEPIESIFPRFATGAMSFGSLSIEAHRTLAKAMNAIGGKSNSGEGGEHIDRLYDPTTRSAIKQVASGRFGVTTEYLVNCNELQIKMAQGAKPGEGGHLPADKVTDDIAMVRHTTPGIDLISPPPHHDIYSIEDLAQLIFDLKNVNPAARINVKLVSEVGVGTVAAGVSKAHADVVLISGHDGGTGAAPLSSIKNTGLPWELGLAEAQQTLLLNDLRSRIVVQTDGQLKTGRDVAIAALLGAEEFGFATAALVVSGCIMMRKCQNNTCPVGVATQDPELRANFKGDPQHVINFFTFIAEELRTHMAALGVRTIDEMVGRVDLLEPDSERFNEKTAHIDFDAILYKPELPTRIAPRCIKKQEHDLDVLDQQLIKDAKSAIYDSQPVRKHYTIQNTNRTVGTMLSSTVTQVNKRNTLPDDTIHMSFKGTAGQSFGAFLVKGITLELEGDANDYLGKGLSGGRIIVYPPKDVVYAPQDNIIVGNTLLYGATSGEIFIRGHAGERFAVRNSGANAVVEGLGDHGCEYMTGGVAVILGPTGRNFGAGMSGGMAFVLDVHGDFEEKNVNGQIVETEKLSDPKDIALVKSLMEKHIHYTDSDYAQTILNHFEDYQGQFVKVISSGYRAILKRLGGDI